MKTLRKLTITALALSTLALSPVQAAPAGDIVVVASGAGSFNTLVAAVKAAGLVETLQGTGPFTVFAPTDEAFAKLPSGTVESLLKPENKEKLVAILTYHVVAGKVMAADVKTMQAKTVNGKDLDIKVTEGTVTVNNAKVIKTDIAAGVTPEILFACPSVTGLNRFNLVTHRLIFVVLADGELLSPIQRHLRLR